MTKQQRKIAKLAARGLSDKQIAKRLNITVSTLKSHLNSIYHQIGASGRVALALHLSKLAK